MVLVECKFFPKFVPEVGVHKVQQEVWSMRKRELIADGGE